MDLLTSRKTTAREETKEGLRRVVATDLYAFATKVLYKDVPRNQLTPHFHGPFCQYVQTTPYLENLYLLFRGCFKTSLITVARNLQRILADPGEPAFRGRPCGPNTRILICSNKAENAEPMLGEIQQHMMNPLLTWLYPHILGEDPTRLPEWTKSGITVLRPNRALRGSTVRAVGITGELTSQHYDHGNFDDIIGKENSQTKEMREGVNDFMRKVRPLFDPGSTRDYVGTHWHYADYYAQLKEDRDKLGTQLGVYERICWQSCAPGAPEGLNMPGFGWKTPTFPERFTMAWLQDERRRMGPADFAAQYLLDPVSSDTQHFVRGHLDVVDHAPPLDDLWIAMTVDPAISTRRWADWAAVAVGGFDMKGDLWLLELKRFKRDEHALVREVYQLALHYPRLMAVGLEAVGFQKAYRSLFENEGRRRGVFLPIIKLEKDTAITKNIRIASRLQPPWMARQIHALRSCEALADFQEEADRFRPDRESQHDDLLDAVADLFQVRGLPSAREVEGDPELLARDRFETDFILRHPEADRLTLRNGWGNHLRVQAEDAQREADALGIGRQDELWA